MELMKKNRLALFQLAVLLLIYSSGTFIRLAPISNWGVYVTADDPVLHVRVTEYVLENGHLPREDSLSWYPWGQNWETTLPNFRYYLTAGLYSLGRSLGSDISIYDFCVIFPALFAPDRLHPIRAPAIPENPRDSPGIPRLRRPIGSADPPTTRNAPR